MSRSYWLPSLFMFPNFLCYEPSSALFMLPKFIYHRVPEVIIYRMRHVPNDATPDCICKVLSFYDHSSASIIVCGYETERRHISGFMYILTKCCHHHQLTIFTTFAQINVGRTLACQNTFDYLQDCIYDLLYIYSWESSASPYANNNNRYIK